MALFKYFKKATSLPNPEGPLSDRMPPAAIYSPNKEVQDLVIKGDHSNSSSHSRKRGPYLSYTEEEKARIAKRAAEFGVTNTLRYFNKEFVNRPLKESTVRTWMTVYKKELASRVKLGAESFKIEKLKTKKRGHPYWLGEEIYRQL